jgi:hypothetical protein
MPGRAYNKLQYSTMLPTTPVGKYISVHNYGLYNFMCLEVRVCTDKIKNLSDIFI